VAAEPDKSFLRDSKWMNLLLLVPVAVVVWLAVTGGDAPVEESVVDTQTEASAPLTAQDMAVVGPWVAASWNGEDPPDTELPARFGDPGVAVFVAVRSESVRKAAQWKVADTVREALEGALAGARGRLGRGASEIDTIEIALTHSYRELDPVKQRGELFSNVHRGVRGLELRHGGKTYRYSPTYIVASNRSNKRLIELFKRQQKLSDAQMENEVEYRTFEADQVLVKLDGPTAHLMHRGNTVVPIEDVTQDNVRRLADLAIEWLVANVHEDGRMTYLYWPSATTEAPKKNNMIRQWMATNALDQAAADRDDPALWDVVERNLDYNITHFYKPGNDGRGVIEFGGKAKLGAMSLAAMSIIAHPKREKWAEAEAGLRATIDTLWNEDGSFTTFAFPPGRSDQQNYYPGETLLFWAELYRLEKDEALRERFMKSFEYYRRWHLEPENRNPAFIPWHTQAYYLMWEQTKDEELKDFVFEMNDWLIEQMQQWEGDVTYPDELGRFENIPRHFGAPHASSTGVYLEGLIDAYRMAKAVGDAERTERYRVAMVRGLRSVMQVQFVDEVDMYYVRPEHRPYVKGGMRTTIYDNRIRCDNVQHNLMGILKILRELSPDEYRHS
jgi:hypothetical protein